MASIQKREGRPRPWRVRWRERGRDRSKSFKLKIQADDFVRAVDELERRGERYETPSDAGTIETLFEARMAERRVEGFARGTLKAEASRYVSLVAPRFGSVSVADVDVEAIREWRTAMLEAGLSVAHTDKAIQLLGSVLARAVASKVIDENPVATLRDLERSRPRSSSGDTQRYPLSWPETFALCEHFKEPHRSVVLVARATGARIAEAFGIRVNRIDLDRRTLTFDAQVERGTRRLVALKTAASAATVPISGFAVEVLAAHLERHPTVGDGLVFVNQAGSPIDYTNWRDRQWARAVAGAGLSDTFGDPVAPTPHDLRRGFGADLARAGVPLKQAQMLMRHGDISVTARLYSDLGVEDLRGSVPEPPDLAGVAPVWPKIETASVTSLRGEPESLGR